jgi:nicotinamide mononucleotide transporter
MELFDKMILHQKYIGVIITWIAANYIEVIAAFTGLIYLFYSIQGNKKLWVYGLITSSIYVYVCFIAGIYADMGINIYYVIVSIYGWIHWNFYRKNDKTEIPISRTRPVEYLIIIAFTAILYFLIAIILLRLTNSTIPYLDALTTSASITATWMLARKMLEHWIIWVFVDAVSIGLYIYKGLYPTSILFLVYTVLAVIGFKQWQNKWKEQIAIV